MFKIGLKTALGKGESGAASSKSKIIKRDPNRIGPLHDPEIKRDPTADMVEQMGEKDEDYVKLLTKLSFSSNRQDLSRPQGRGSRRERTAGLDKSMFGNSAMFDGLQGIPDSKGRTDYKEEPSVLGADVVSGRDGLDHMGNLKAQNSKNPLGMNYPDFDQDIPEVTIFTSSLFCILWNEI